MIKLVHYADWHDRIGELLSEHAEEAPHGFALAPDVETYRNLEDRGMLFTLVATDGDALVGYATMLLYRSPHNPSVCKCLSDAIFVKPSHRNRTTGGMLIRAAENEAMNRGASRIGWGAPVHGDFDHTLESHEYEAITVMYERAL